MGQEVHSIYGTKYPYVSVFHTGSGAYVRTGILKDGKDTGKDPFMADFPELLDVGIMGSCIHGKSGLCRQAGIDCYQNGPGICQQHMALRDFQRIIQECQGRVYQIALGGRGDPDQHPYFEKMLEYSRLHGIVPNYTTSGFGMTPRLAKISSQYCGAVAVSWYKGTYTHRAAHLLMQAGAKTNIHFVLNSKTIGEAVRLLTEGGFPNGVNAVIFLLYKPVGLGKREYILKENTPYLKEFFKEVDKGGFPYKIGFDSCTVPGLLQYTANINMAGIDTCEAGRWSAYVTPDMYLLPCSFDSLQRKWAASLHKYTIEQAWNSTIFDSFRFRLGSACPACVKRDFCMGGCPICPEIVLCSQKDSAYGG